MENPNRENKRSMDDFRKMTLSGVVVDPDSRSPSLVLKDATGRFLLPIWVGVMEAGAVTAAIEGVEAPQPMTHDLILKLLDALGAELDSVWVTDLEDGVFHAHLDIQTGGGLEKKTIPCRPSDGLALAARTGAPIFVRDVVVSAASIVVQTAGLGVGPVGDQSLEELLASLPDELFGKYET